MKKILLSLSLLIVGLSYGQMVSTTNAWSIQNCNGHATFDLAASYSAPVYSWHWNSDPNNIDQVGGATYNNICPASSYSFHLDSAGIEIHAENFTIGSDDPCLGLHVSSYGYMNTAPSACTGYMSCYLAGGTEPFTYNWSNGDTTYLIYNLCAGNYNVTVHDALGCVAYGNLAITEDPQLSPELQVTLQVGNSDSTSSCTGFIGTSAYGGVAPYTYLWSTGATTNYIDNLCPGNYSVTVYDAAGDSVVLDTVIGVLCSNFAINNFNVINTLNNQCDGSVTVQVTGGVSPYYYAWSNNSTIDSIYGLCPGYYSVTVYDNMGCAVTDSAEVLAVSIDFDFFLTMDSLGNCTGTASVVPLNGSAPYMIQWSNGDSTNSVNNLCAGVYSVSIMDANANTAALSFAITDPSSDYGTYPYVDSTVVGYLYNYLEENCVINYQEIDSASLASAVYDSVSQNLYVTWAIFTPTDTILILDTLGFNGGNGVYNLMITVFCPQKSLGNYMSVHGQIYMGHNESTASVSLKNPLTVQSFPNPFESTVNVILDKVGDYLVQLKDIYGRTVYVSEYRQTSQFVVELGEDLPHGNYFLVIEPKTESSIVLRLSH